MQPFYKRKYIGIGELCVTVVIVLILNAAAAADGRRGWRHVRRGGGRPRCVAGACCPCAFGGRCCLELGAAAFMIYDVYCLLFMVCGAS